MVSLCTGVPNLIKPNGRHFVHYPSAQTEVISKLMSASSKQSASYVWTQLMELGIYFRLKKESKIMVQTEEEIINEKTDSFASTKGPYLEPFKLACDLYPLGHMGSLVGQRNLLHALSPCLPDLAF